MENKTTYEEAMAKFKEFARNNPGKVIVMKEQTWLDYDVFKVLIRVLGKLSFEDMENMSNKEDAQTLSDWYFNNRHR